MLFVRMSQKPSANSRGEEAAAISDQLQLICTMYIYSVDDRVFHEFANTNDISISPSIVFMGKSDRKIVQYRDLATQTLFIEGC